MIQDTTIQEIQSRQKPDGERKVAIRALEDVGFCKLLHLPRHILDMKTVPHDYVFMGADLHVDEEYAGVGE